VLVVELPRSIAMWSSGLLTAGLLLAVFAQTRGRAGTAGVTLVRSGVFALHQLIVVPLAIHRYVQSAITGRTTWEKTAHGASVSRREGDL
jgi:hypothetical protein